MNVLISSLSKKVPLVQAVRKALKKCVKKGKIFGADVNPHCVGRYFVDHFWHVPLLHELELVDFLNFCTTHHVKFVIPTRDGELSFFAENKQRLSKEGIEVMVSSVEVINLCLDKQVFYQTLNGLGLSAISTSEHPDFSNVHTYVVKERFGAASEKVGLKLTKEQAIQWAQKLNDPIFQPHIAGEEISIDLYVDKTGEAKGVICRRRDLVIDGESQVTTSFRDEPLELLCGNLAERLGLYGHVMFQVIRGEQSGDYHFLECNPRFGGASTLSIEMGLDSFYWFMLEGLGKNLDQYPFKMTLTEKQLLRHPADTFL